MMTKTLIPFGDIEQLRNVVFDVKHKACCTGFAEDGNPIYDYTLTLPTISFSGTVKLHGTNASVVWNEQDGMWAQSRDSIIKVGQDNAGFASFVEANKDAFQELIDSVYKTESFKGEPYDEPTPWKYNTVTIFGEWAGKGVQSGVAISQLEKAFYIFGIEITPHDSKIESYWIDCAKYSNPEHRIFNVYDYGTYSVMIDFNDLEPAQQALEAITATVESECPVAKAFGVSGVGEGVVWIGSYGDETLRFKVKGTKHKISKTKEAVPVDVEKLDSFNEFVDYAVTQARFDQAIEKVFGSYNAIDIRKMGDVIKWMQNDVQKEEMDTLKSNGLEFGAVSKYITAKTKSMFLEAVKL